MDKDLDTGTPWNYHDNPKTIWAVAVGAGILALVLAFGLSSDRTRIATNAPTSQAPVTAPPLVPVPPVAPKAEPRA